MLLSCCATPPCFIEVDTLGTSLCVFFVFSAGVLCALCAATSGHSPIVPQVAESMGESVPGQHQLRGTALPSHPLLHLLHLLHLMSSFWTKLHTKSNNWYQVYRNLLSTASLHLNMIAIANVNAQQHNAWRHDHVWAQKVLDLQAIQWKMKQLATVDTC